MTEVFGEVRSDLRRRDIVACFDSSHLVLLMSGMPPARAKDRLSETLSTLGVGTPPRFHVGIAQSPAPGSKPFETLLAEADAAMVAARQAGALVVVSGETVVPVEAPRRARGRIVLADDDPDVVRLIDAQLRAAGYDTVLAHDGGQAVAAVEEHQPDVIIVDLMMPRMTGFDVLTRLQRAAVRPRAIVLSAKGREQDVTRAFALGADDYVTKPFSPQELLARIERLTR